MEKGAWTSALEVMGRMILRHASSLVSDPRNGTINTFQGVREKLTKRKYTQFTERKDDIVKMLQIAQLKEDSPNDEKPAPLRTKRILQDQS
jgi:hypothetical protein